MGAGSWVQVHSPTQPCAEATYGCLTSMFLSCSPSFPSTVSKIQWRKYPQVRINPSTSTFALLKRISFCNDNAPRTSIWNRVSCWHQQWKIISPYQKGLASWPLSVPPLKAFSQIPPLKVSQLSHKLESAEKKKKREGDMIQAKIWVSKCIWH